jgi:hypothetical protein
MRRLASLKREGPTTEDMVNSGVKYQAAPQFRQSHPGCQIQEVQGQFSNLRIGSR